MPFLASAMAGLMEWWILQGMPVSPQEMVEQLWLLLAPYEVFGNS